MGFEPKGRVGVVTGSAGGIGLGIARAFAGAGMKVVLADVDAARLETAATELRASGAEVLAKTVDVTSFDSVKELAQATMDTFGRVDVLCNNAGVGIFKRIEDATLDDFAWTIDIDLWGPIHGIKAFLPLIKANTQPGHISSTSSVAGLLAGQTAGAYNVAKHAVVALMATLERELRSAKSIHRASVLCPGPINTDISRNSVRQRRATQGRVDLPAASDTDPAKKLGDRLDDTLSKGMHPDEVGHLVLDAIINERFWIFTHPRLLKHLREQVDAMESGELSRLRMF